MSTKRPGLVAAFAAALAFVTVPVAAQTNPAATPASGAVNYLPADKVNAAFAKGLPIVETGAYKVIAGRRDRDGQAEVHARDTDIMYVIEGTATLVTGGQVVGGKSTAADEIRGDTITGGDPRPLVKGDVIIIPSGIPHLFKDVKAPFLYYVVKVTSPGGK
jgi:mannose-6-phosphate isomerase-like protein (cupin superfamily)